MEEVMVVRERTHLVAICIPLSDDKHQMVPDSSKKSSGQRGRNSNPVATLPHAAVVFRMQPFNITIDVHLHSPVRLQMVQH